MTRIEDRSGPVLGYRLAAHVSAILIFVQPFLAGQFLTGGDDGWKDVHLIVGEILQLTVLAQLVLCFLARRTFGIGLVIFNLVFFILTALQVRIGHSDDGDLIALHIPLGTILLTLGTIAVFLSFFDLRRQRRPADSAESL
jgi:hypothetical protein